jgi:hypothetical protein
MLQAGRSGSRFDEVNGWIFSICLTIPAALGPGVHLASNRNEYHKQKNNVLGSIVRPVRRGDNLTTISEPIV